MKKITLLSVLLLFFGELFAQPHIQVVQDGAPFSFVQHSVVELDTNLYVIAGTVMPGPISGYSDILVMLVDHGGSVIWAKYIDYGQDEFAGSLMVDANHDIVLTGYTGVNNTPNKRLIIVKLNGAGTYINDMTIFDSGYGLYGFDIEQTNAGDYIVVGTGVAAPTFSAGKYGFVLKVDQGLNNIAWSHIYNSTSGVPTNLDSFNDILKVPDLPGPWNDMYLLTGSGTDNANNYQMVVNAMIDPLVGMYYGFADIMSATAIIPIKAPWPCTRIPQTNFMS